MQTKLPIWWEKTVEYKFIAELALANRLAFAAPLSGRPERTAGDAIIGLADKFILIEYKRSESDIQSEKELFLNFKEAQETFKGTEHHLIVYGYLSTESTFELAATLYFACEYKPTNHITEIVDLGVSFEHFMCYLEALSAHKIPYGGSSGGTGGFHASMNEMCSVLGVSNSGSVVSSQTLYEFAPLLFPQLDNSLSGGYDEDEPDFTPSGRFGL